MSILSPVLIGNHGLTRDGLIALYDPGLQILQSATGQTLTDYSGNSNNAQLGSTAGVDANDPTWTSVGLSYGADDYCQTPITITEEATLIVAVTTPDLSVARGFIGNRGGTNTRSSIYMNQTTGSVLYSVASSSGKVSGLSLSAGESACLMLRYTNGDLYGFKGATKSSLLTYTNTWGTKVQWDIGNIANSVYNGGNILFTAIYNSVLSDAEYLHNYYYLKSLMAGRGIAI